LTKWQRQYVCLFYFIFFYFPPSWSYVLLLVSVLYMLLLISRVHRDESLRSWQSVEWWLQAYLNKNYFLNYWIELLNGLIDRELEQELLLC
jgi:hypothetical protein